MINNFKTYLQVEKGCPETTVRTYVNAILDFYNVMNIQDFHSVTKREIRSYLCKLKEEKFNNASTRNKKLSSLRAFFRFLLKENIIKTNPTSGIENAKQRKSLPKVLSKDEICKMSEVVRNIASTRDRVIIELFFATGMRISELTNLRLRQFNLREKYLIIFGKGQKERFCPLDDKIVQLIIKYLTERKVKSKFLFPSSIDHNRPMDNSAIRKIIYKYGNLADIKIKPHTIRHTFATDLCSNGADIRIIQELLGHSDIRSTQIYTKVNNELIKETYQKCRSITI